MMLQRVMISCATSERKEYIRDEYLRNITAFTYPNKQYFFSDNSYSRSYHAENFLVHGFDCGWINPNGKKSNQVICESYNQIREHFLKSDCGYLFTLEIDLIPHKGIIEEMLAYQKSIVSCRYFLGSGEGSHLLATEFTDNFGKNINRNIWNLEGYMEYSTGKTISGNSGLGCLMLHRSIVEMFPFHIIDKDTHNDTIFARDLEYMGIETTYHDEIIVHRNSNWNYVI